MEVSDNSKKANNHIHDRIASEIAQGTQIVPITDPGLVLGSRPQRPCRRPVYVVQLDPRAPQLALPPRRVYTQDYDPRHVPLRAAHDRIPDADLAPERLERENLFEFARSRSRRVADSHVG